MQAAPNESNYSLSQADLDALDDLATTLELSSGTTIIFAVAPESGPKHPVVEQLKSRLSEEEFYCQNFFYSENALANFLYSLDASDGQTGNSPSERRRVVMAFGIEQLPRHRIGRELRQLNLGRESLFEQEMVLIFWLNKSEFLEEFRNRASDFWDWREKVVRFEARPPLDPLFYPYLESLIAENSYLKISGVMQVQRQVDIFLDQVYVSLRAERQQRVSETADRGESFARKGMSRRGAARYEAAMRHDGSMFKGFEDAEPIVPDFVPASMSTKTVTQKVDLAQAVRDSQFSVILGDPGAGKTTLLRYLALHFAQAVRDERETVLAGEMREDLGKTRLPVFFRIADYAERLAKQPDLSLLDFLGEFSRMWEADFKHQSEAETGTGVAELLCEKMRYGKCVVLLDGLDEVFDKGNRQQIVQRIEEFVAAYSENKFVITSRIAGYRDVKLSDRFAHFTIAEMESKQIEGFLHRWCLAIEQAQKPEASEELWQKAAEDEARELLKGIDENEGVKRLTGNPLLLTILGLIHRNGSRLPQRRVELYSLAVKTLTEDWQLGKKLPDAPKAVLRESEVVELLAPLAYWMHEEKPSGLITQAEAVEKLAEKLAELNDEDSRSKSVRQAVEEFLRRVRETTGLFVERAPGVYGFMHLTFEEYFAARYIADNEVSDMLELIRKHLHEARWHEPILLALGYLGIHSPRQVNRLLERLFSDLEDYQPTIGYGETKIKNASSSDPILVWSVLGEDSAISRFESASVLKKLLFAGRVLAEVEVNSRIRSRVIEKLVMTLVLLDTDSEGETPIQVVKLLRQIELFNQKGEVVDSLKSAANNPNISNVGQTIAWLVILYIACGEPGSALVNCATDMVNQLNPLLFSGLKGMAAELGEEMTPALEVTRQDRNIDFPSQQALTFITALSHIRIDHYAQAIALLEQLIDQPYHTFNPFIAWALAACYQAQDKYEKAIDYYQQSYDRLAIRTPKGSLTIFWDDWGTCYRLCEKYEQSLECFHKQLAIAQELNHSKYEAEALHELGRSYQGWGKYEEAISYYQQSRQLNEQLGREQNASNQWYWLADCYLDLGKYQQAIECRQKHLKLHQKLGLEADVALAYYQLGRIYQAWNKYEEAIAHYQQSRQLYEQLDLQKNVANQWYWLADCYRDWGKYEQAVECQQQCLVVRQALDEQSLIAVTYYQFGYIYQTWGKYEEAIAHHQQSRQLYEQLERQKDVANQWYWLANCYRDWGKYEQAVECQQQCLAVRQQLDDQSDIALAYYQLGRIYQDWGKCEEAIVHYQQSRQLYEQLDLQKDVADSWYCLASCYRDWGKYEQAVECELKDLAIRQQLDDQSDVALAYNQLGRIYRAWGKYEEAIAHYQQSCELYEQLELEKNVANQWDWLSYCYQNWGKYEQAVECQQKCLNLCQELEDKPGIANAYNQAGRVYQAWSRYAQAIECYEQSRDLYQQLGWDKDVAVQLSLLSNCYRDWGKYEQSLDYQQQRLKLHQRHNNQSEIADVYDDLGSIYQSWDKYEQAVEYRQQSCEFYQQLDRDEDIARSYRELGYSQHLLAKNTPDRAEALNLLTQAERNIRQAIELDTAGDYKENLAYDRITLALLYSERLRLLPPNDPSPPEQIAQFEEHYTIGFTDLTELGQTVNRANEALDIARAYLEIPPLQNLTCAEALAHESLQVFLDYNRYKLQAAAYKLLGEIHLRRPQPNQSNTETTARQYLTASLQLYRQLDLSEKASQVEQLMQQNTTNAD